ncbi:slit homolog 3 protein-like [Aphidius gifuensis]|uniref:slit homolog 3 protein-like n=1 Tax=Aphidius gifuensis TaxID=684658 RepID=UPI001CDBA4F5|nr:slit homolog 3 protein-like [Aphidius gifuensis]
MSLSLSDAIGISLDLLREKKDFIDTTDEIISRTSASLRVKIFEIDQEKVSVASQKTALSNKKVLFQGEVKNLISSLLRALMDTNISTSSINCHNKYFCNQESPYYNQQICELLCNNAEKYEMNLSRRASTSLPRYLFQGLENLQLNELDISYNKLTTLPKDIFEPLDDLRTLLIESNELKYLEPSIFYDLLQLQVLNLSKNKLVTLSKDIFNGLQDLCALRLNSNQLSYFEPGTFDDLLSLNYLDISDNNLTNLSRDIFSSLRELSYLDLYSNKLQNLESGCFNGLSQLEKLNIGNNSLATLSEGVFNGLENLQTLYLDSNKLHNFSAGCFNSLSRLSKLNLSNNSLATLSKGVFDDLENIQNLNLKSNTLSNLESGCFDDLSQLDMSNNSLTTLSKGVLNDLQKRRILNLNSNELQNLESGCFNNLLRLHTLDISENKLTTLSKDIFNDLQKLRILNLNANTLQNLESGCFNGLSQLQELDLSRNKLTTLSKDIFNGLQKLSFLYLNSNELQKLELDIFNHLSQLQELYLSKNKLITLSKDIFSSLQDLLCQKWKRALDYSWSNVKKLQLTHWKYNKHPNCLIKYPKRDRKLSFLKSLLHKCGRYLTQLDLTAYGHSDIVRVINEYCPNLVKLRLRFSPVEDEFLALNAFSRLSKLKVLAVIFQCDSTQLYMLHYLITALLALADTLTELTLFNWQDDQIPSYINPKNYTFYKFTRTTNFVLCRLKNLKKFEFGGIIMYPELEEYLRNNHTIECSYYDRSLKKNVIKPNEFGSVMNITTLSLSKYKVSDDSLYTIANTMKQLTKLKINCEWITNEGVVAISKINNLTHLCFFGVNDSIDSSSIKLLKNLNKLMLLRSNKVTDDLAMKVLENSPNMEMLLVPNTSVTVEFIKKAAEISRNRKQRLLSAVSFKIDKKRKKQYESPYFEIICLTKLIRYITNFRNN